MLRQRTCKHAHRESPSSRFSAAVSPSCGKKNVMAIKPRFCNGPIHLSNVFMYAEKITARILFLHQAGMKKYFIDSQHLLQQTTQRPHMVLSLLSITFCLGNDSMSLFNHKKKQG
mmetsp:Transcript_132263/g.247266  ORF Transcript_132263/g.247266 Transcript_132263/m.247266 type:complete len:115 (+) Transcript_132263:68-412(+)